MAFSKVKAGGLADNSVGSSQISPDTVVASDIAANAVTASELADNAVDTDAIAANAVVTAKIADSTGASDGITTAKLATNAVTTAKITDANITTAKVANSAITSLKLGDVIDTVPHIIPGVLQPAIAGKLLNGANHSGAYGTPQTQSGGDGHSYYYTDIKGSKPIKDPRIGAYFGSQRHKAKSIQLLEQETALHGQDVYSIDGREWMRVTGPDIRSYYNDNTTGNVGTATQGTAGTFIEIVGYFSDANYIQDTHTAERNIITSVDGGSTNTNSSFVTSVGSPLSGRCVDEASVGHLNLPSTHSTSLGIHTLKINWPASNYPYFFGIELIAQDTTSTARRSEIKIPKQNVVSFGKKFEVGSDDLDNAVHPHYDPFTTMSYGGSGTTASALANLIDTATSLGMDNWKAGGDNFHRPWNGGRVIKWVDSSGTIKTSVNMMPPNAQNIGTTASNPVSNTEVVAGTNGETINFNTSAIDHSQAEVAKTWNCYEFGNGNANGGHDGPYKDATMLDASGFDDIAYVMDDGLSSLVIDNARQYDLGEGIYLEASKSGYITFIGTGISIYSSNSGVEATKHIAQNLHYGTHVLKITTAASHNVTTLTLDGVQLNSSATHFVYAHFEDITFHQPKRPPIPEDCVVLADYMLMADFVPTTSVDGSISKGVRYCNASRDVFYDSAAALTYNAGYPSLGYQGVSFYNNNANNEARITAFGSAYESHYVRGTNRVSNTQARLDGSNYSYVEADVYDTGGEWDDTNDDGTLTKAGSEAFHMYGIKNQTLGVHTFGDKNSSGSDYNAWSAFAVATPIHTSSHYQAFETPFLHELVGGDRNVEQTNLICTPDGKTWDEVTRDTSYIGSACVSAGGGPDNDSSSGAIVLTEYRGALNPSSAVKDLFNKNWAIAYDRFICLKTGYYLIHYTIKHTNNSSETYIYRNSGTIAAHPTINGAVNMAGAHYFSRGDVLRLEGVWDDNDFYNYFQITELK